MARICSRSMYGLIMRWFDLILIAVVESRTIFSRAILSSLPQVIVELSHSDSTFLTASGKFSSFLSLDFVLVTLITACIKRRALFQTKNLRRCRTVFGHVDIFLCFQCQVEHFLPGARPPLEIRSSYGSGHQYFHHHHHHHLRPTPRGSIERRHRTWLLTRARLLISWKIA